MKFGALYWSVAVLACLGISACDVSTKAQAPEADAQETAVQDEAADETKTALPKAASGAEVSMVDGTNPDDWPSYGRTYGEQHFSPLDQVNAETVDRLGLAWSLDLPVGNTTTQPIVVDGVIYFAARYSVVHAVDAVTGELLWTYDPEVPQHVDDAGRMLIAWGSRGIAWWNGKVYTITNAGRMIALDTETGEPVWEKQIIAPDDQSYFTAAPRVFDGVVVIGNSGDTGPTRGHFTALDAETGEQLWRFWVVPGNPEDGFERPELEMAAETWSGEWWKFGGNGAPWNAYTYDPETGTVFVGTGNGFPFNHRLRSEGEGDNLFLSSVVALDLKSGEYKWHYQGTPADTWDFTMTHDMALADLEIDGELRKVLVTAPKNGFFFVIDRITGEFISAEPFVKVTWATHYDENGRPVEAPGARYEPGTTFDGWPTVFGGHNWQAQAYSPQTKLAYIPVVDLGGTFTDNTDETTWDPEHGEITTGLDATGDVENSDRPEEATAALLAWDPVKQERVWRVQADRMVPAGVMATGGGLVFQGAVDGYFSAYDAATGEEVWSYDMKAPGVIAPVTYAVDGRQYVTILTGTSGVPSAWGRMVHDLGLDYRSIDRRVLTFALDGEATLPPRTVVDLQKPEDPDYEPMPELEEAGRELYGGMCATCHGYKAVAGGRAPDLRYSPMQLDADMFEAVVQDGALLSAGMPRFGFLSDEDIEAIRQYVRAQAHDPELDEAKNVTGMAIAPR